MEWLWIAGCGECKLASIYLEVVECKGEEFNIAVREIAKQLNYLCFQG